MTRLALTTCQPPHTTERDQADTPSIYATVWRRIRLSVVRILIGSFAISTPSYAVDFNQMYQTYLKRWGQHRETAYTNWYNALDASFSSPETQKLGQINRFFNNTVTWSDDLEIWNSKDYWATPLETLGKGQADCEDYSIGKYYSLLVSAFPENKLRLIYVRARLPNQGSQAHMVLAYYPTPTAEPLILDNIIGEIKPASQRNDLSPVFSFNRQGVWSGIGTSRRQGQLSRWQVLQTRTQQEGFDV